MLSLLWLLLNSAVASEVNSNQVNLLRCVAEIKNIQGRSAPSQIFQTPHLILGSARFKEQGQKEQIWLFALNDREIAVIRLPESGRQNVSFVLPNADPRKTSQTHYVVYSHSDVYGSRVVTTSVDSPPVNFTSSQFKASKPVALSKTLAQRYFIQLIGGELRQIADLYRKNRLSHTELLSGNLSLCRGMSDVDQAMSSWLDRQITELEVVSQDTGFGRRTPASLGF